MCTVVSGTRFEDAWSAISHSSGQVGVGAGVVGGEMSTCLCRLGVEERVAADLCCGTVVGPKGWKDMGGDMWWELWSSVSIASFRAYRKRWE